jgi:hypothetical protein
MSIIIVCGGSVGTIIGPPDDSEDPIGQYLEAYDPNAMDGYGVVLWTPDAASAKRFDSLLDAFEFSRRIPQSRPLRDDGQPNRPLTAYTLTFESVP